MKYHVFHFVLVSRDNEVTLVVSVYASDLLQIDVEGFPDFLAGREVVGESECHCHVFAVSYALDILNVLRLISSPQLKEVEETEGVAVDVVAVLNRLIVLLVKVVACDCQ